MARIFYVFYGAEGKTILASLEPPKFVNTAAAHFAHSHL